MRGRLIYVCAILLGLASLYFTAYVQWSGPTPGWAASAFSFVGFLVFWHWLAEGAQAFPGPHDPDLGRLELIACAAGFLANVLLIAGLVLAPCGAQRLARTFGRIALASGLASIVLLKISLKMFELRLGGCLWLAAIAVLAFSRLDPPSTPDQLDPARR